MILLKNYLKFSGLAVLCSCAGAVKDQTVTTVAEEELTPNRALAKQAKKISVKQDDPSRIIGSSHINKPDEYQGKTYFLYGAEHLKLDNYYFDIPVVYNDAVKVWIDYFLGRGRGFFQRYGARAGRYAPLMGKILEDYGLPRDLIFLAMAESGFQNKARSWAAAVGPWQFMPATGKRYGLKIDWYIDERRDPIKASIAASKYLTKLYNDFGSWELAAAGYNAGEGKVSRAIRRYNTESFWDLRKGRYLKDETKNYVPKIMALAIIGKNLKAFGFEEMDFHEPLDFEEIDVPSNTDIIQVAEALSVDVDEMYRLNPELLRWFTPPNIESYKLRVPVGAKTAFAECCNPSDFPAKDYQEYLVRGQNSTLQDVARRFKINNTYVLENLNNMKSNAVLKRGTKVVIPFRSGQSLNHEMYADLYVKPRKSVVAAREYRGRVQQALSKGKRITNPTAYYEVKRGDSLWSIAKKTGTSIDTLIASNANIIQSRSIRAGDRLVIR